MEATFCSHTPGPWVVDGEGITIGTVCTHESGVCQEITVPSVSVFTEISAPEAVANARLIASAPDLLAALKAVSETGDDCPVCDRGRLRNPEKTHWPECHFGRAQAVIATAEGR